MENADIVRRAYVEKKPGDDVEAGALLRDVHENLGLKNIDGLRIAARYDVEGLSEAEFDLACRQVFCEKPVDLLYREDLPLGDREQAVAVEYLPGQYDQRADSAAQCVQLLTLKEQPAVRTARVYVLKGSLEPAEVEAFCKYCINPVDSRIASAAKPATLRQELPPPPDVPVLAGFRKLEGEVLEDFRRRYALSMSVEDLAYCREYFCGEGRDPSLTELRVVDTYWSDHCRHTTFHTVIESCVVEESRYKKVFEDALTRYLALRKEAGGEDKPFSLMDMATVNARAMRKAGLLDDLDASEEVNACSIRVLAETDRGSEPWLVMFKNETHNHPTEIEPFGGAATCIGGAIRDPLSGRAYVYQAMRVTGSADPREAVADTLPGKLPQRTITRQAAAGYSSYGNQIGLATGLVDEVYHPGYKAKRLEIGAVVGAAPEVYVRRATPAQGDLILLLGGRTGRDGIGGATGSSKVHDEQSLELSGAEVQKGNAPTERKLQRLYRDPEFTRLIKRCNDFGAGGVSVAIGELAPGLDIDLDKIPKKYEGLDGTELAISESQERMAVVIDPDSLDKVLALAAGENLEATVVAVVAAHGRMKMTWRSREIVDLPRVFLDSAGVGRKTTAVIPQPGEGSFIEDEGRRLSGGAPGFEEAWQKCMGELDHCSKKGLIQRFDSTIGGGSLLFPLGGSRQETPAQAMAARLPAPEGRMDTCSWMSYGLDPALSAWSPFHGGLYAVVDALTKLACAGGDPFGARMSFQEYFPSLGADPAMWGLPMAALLGAQTAMSAFGVPAIGGKDSMSGSFGELEVPPTLCAFALSVGADDAVLSPEWKEPGSLLAVLPAGADEMLLPDTGRIMGNFRFLRERRKHIRSAYALGAGGLAAAIAKASFGNDLGAVLSLPLSASQLFEPAYGAVMLELDADFPEALIKEAGGYVAGKTSREPLIRLDYYDTTSKRNSVSVSVDALRRPWSQALEPVFPTSAAAQESMSLSAEAMPLRAEAVPLSAARGPDRPAGGLAKPRVVIPVFPGTNCEYDSAAVFERAGADADIVVLRNLSPADVEESMRRLASAIAKAQIVMLPGGFSAGDEPDGSGKLIAAAFRSPWVREQTEDLLHRRGGLMLGVCNGFQALIKLGLVPYGEIREMADDSPTLMANAIGRHQNVIAMTRVTSVASPWLAGMEPGEIHHIPISHGEGRIKASPAELALLFARGQVATQYVDGGGAPSMDIRFNPNGSACAIEGLTSPDGRVLGKMGHNERSNPGLYRNVPGNYDQRLFANGVKYFH
ncbi:MAG: phosphoribosylformylglycinamidine synthase [Clostridiales bacterium]|nr:phosphoribosylformylglycinamidine synthase [Clostridiales bacterium]